VILLLGTDREEAAGIAERVRQTIRELDIPHQVSGVDDAVTVSVGVCNLIPEKNLSSGDLFQRAYKMLYLAKQERKNCVKCA